MELLAVVSIVLLMAAFLFPQFAKIMETSNKAGCASNLHALGGAIQEYTADNGYYPPATGEDGTGNWLQLIGPNYLGQDWNALFSKNTTASWKRANVFNCPSEKANKTGFVYTYAENDDTRTDLAPNGHLRPQNLANPSLYVLVSDSYDKYYLLASTQSVLASYGVNRRHNGHPNVLYADGHVASYTGPVMGYNDGDPQDFYLKMWRWNGQVRN